jgi:3-oxoacyl-[acyl-carrier protein] reductase
MTNQSADSRFDEKIVVITGASGGIGQAAARRFAQSGASVFLHAHRNIQIIEQLRQEILQYGGRCECFQADFSKPAEPERFVQSVFGKTKRIDIWVNGAGVDLMIPSLAKFTFEKKMQKIFQVDVFALTQMSIKVGKLMKEQGGGIIFFFSWNGVDYGWKGETALLYGAAKGAIQGFSRSFAETFAPCVRTCCLSLGWIKTRWGQRTSDDFIRQGNSDSLMNRWGTSAEVAETILFLSGDAAGFVDGLDFRLDGRKRGTR